MKSKIQQTIINEFAEDPLRTTKLIKKLDVNDEFLYFDFSKTHLNEKALDELIKDLDSSKIMEMFDKKNINFTENRKVLHVTLRDKKILDVIENNVSCKNFKDEEKVVYDELRKIKKIRT